ncbi:hypothetical protein GCM10018793_57290 [Streptomyces sulfonofaciens]|uniref:Uncharacterized protein n=1 Tax=Streptomyces sulfonofaciens TaxID=68272 RepID=A0A919GKN9_9ACTN|nr:hypothetical protein GCM10018793_57290 [Streptomyces sulfonofaciens]
MREAARPGALGHHRRRSPDGWFLRRNRPSALGWGTGETGGRTARTSRDCTGATALGLVGAVTDFPEVKRIVTAG